MEIEYHPNYFRLGDEKYINPEYILTNRTVKDVNEGGNFRNPDLYEFTINENAMLIGLWGKVLFAYRVEEYRENDTENSIPEIIDIIIEDDCCTALCEDGTVWAWGSNEWNSGAVQYHDNKYAMSNPEIYGEDYILRNTNPNRSKTGWIYDLPLKTVDFYKLDWESIASINSNGAYCFSAVDEQGECFCLDVVPRKDVGE